MSADHDLDQVFSRIEKLATARQLPEVARATSYGTPALKVRSKTFVRLKDATTLVLLCPPEQKTLLMEISPISILKPTTMSAGRPCWFGSIQ